MISPVKLLAGAAVAALCLVSVAGAQDRTPDVRLARQLVAGAAGTCRAACG